MPSSANPKKIHMWFKLPKLPFEFVEYDVLKLMGDSFGTFLLFDSVYEDGNFLVKICVLANPNDNLPRICNIKSINGIWRQDILKDSNDFGKPFVVMDSPLFSNLKNMFF